FPENECQNGCNIPGSIPNIHKISPCCGPNKPFRTTFGGVHCFGPVISKASKPGCMRAARKGILFSMDEYLRELIQVILFFTAIRRRALDRDRRYWSAGLRGNL